MTAIVLDTQILNDAARIAIAGRLEHSNRSSFRAQVELALAARCTAITIDLTHCTGVDSAGLGCLVSCSKQAREKGAVLSLAGIDLDLRAVMIETKLDELFTFDDGEITGAETGDADPHGARHG